MKFLHEECSILVPTANAQQQYPFVNGSGLVGVKTDDYGVIYYEGNLNGCSNLNTIDDRVIVAAGRLMTKYPTVARTGHLADEMDELYDIVGTVNLVGGKLTLNVTDREKLDAWFQTGQTQQVQNERVSEQADYGQQMTPR